LLFPVFSGTMHAVTKTPHPRLSEPISPDSLPGYDKKPDAQNQRVSHFFLSPGIEIPRKAAVPGRIRFGTGPIEHCVTSHQPYASGDGSVPCPPWMGGTGNRDYSLENRMTSDLTRMDRQAFVRIFRHDSRLSPHKRPKRTELFPFR